MSFYLQYNRYPLMCLNMQMTEIEEVTGLSVIFPSWGSRVRVSFTAHTVKHYKSANYTTKTVFHTHFLNDTS